MAEITQMQNADGVDQYPITVTAAVYDSEGIPIGDSLKQEPVTVDDEVLSTISEKLNWLIENGGGKGESYNFIKDINTSELVTAYADNLSPGKTVSSNGVISINSSRAGGSYKGGTARIYISRLIDFDTTDGILCYGDYGNSGSGSSIRILIFKEDLTYIDADAYKDGTGTFFTINTKSLTGKGYLGVQMGGYSGDVANSVYFRVGCMMLNA